MDINGLDEIDQQEYLNRDATEWSFDVMYGPERLGTMDTAEDALELAEAYGSVKVWIRAYEIGTLSGDIEQVLNLYLDDFREAFGL